MTLHRGGLQRISPFIWASLDLEVLLFSDTSTAAPAKGDVFVSEVDPASNELSNADYARQDLTGLSATWDGDGWRLYADDVDFGPITSEGSTPQGVKGWALYAKVTNDSDSILVRSYHGPTQDLTGDNVRIAWTDGEVLLDGDEDFV